MKKHHFICTIAVLLAMVANVQAQEERNKSLINSYLHGWEYNIKAGFNIGGTSPIPLPKEIRKIDSYAPGIAIAIEGNATKWFDEKKKWGLTLGLRLENKNMTTEATVKNYGMKNHQYQRRRAGRSLDGWSQNQSENSYLTIPILCRLPYQQALDSIGRSVLLLSAGRQLLRTRVRGSLAHTRPDRFQSRVYR